MLSEKSYGAARDFIRSSARPLDRALFEHRFEGASRERVLDELAAYQNRDGGFGRALEADIRLEASSPIATSVALQYAIELGTPHDPPLIRRAIGYLLDTLDEEAGYWPATFLDVSDAPHAPWWTIDAVAPPEPWSWANPSAELLGYLHAYDEYVPVETLARLDERAREALAVAERRPEPPDFFSMMTWRRARPHVPPRLGEEIEQMLTRAWKRHLPLDDEKLGIIDVTALAPTPDSPLAQLDRAAVERLLQEEIERQADDGGWWPKWQWGDEEMWAQVSREWAGKLTVEMLSTLRAFGMLPG